MGGRERCGQKGGQKNWLNMKNNRRSMLEARTFGLDSSFKYEETDPRKTMSDQNYLETYDPTVTSRVDKVKTRHSLSCHQPRVPAQNDFTWVIHKL